MTGTESALWTLAAAILWIATAWLAIDTARAYRDMTSDYGEQ